MDVLSSPSALQTPPMTLKRGGTCFSKRFFGLRWGPTIQQGPEYLTVHPEDLATNCWTRIPDVPLLLILHDGRRLNLPDVYVGRWGMFVRWRDLTTSRSTRRFEASLSPEFHEEIAVLHHFVIATCGTTCTRMGLMLAFSSSPTARRATMFCPSSTLALSEICAICRCTPS